MWASLVAGGVSGLVSPFTQAHIEGKQLEYQKQLDKQMIEQREKEQKAQLKLLGYISLGAAILIVIYLALKD